MTSPNPHAIDTDTLSGMKPLRQAVFALSSASGEREENLQGALNALAGTPDVFVVEISSVYESTVAEVASLSAVVLVDTTLSEDRLVDRLMTIESVYRRTRGEEVLSRALDMDLIVVGDVVVDRDGVVLPHPTAKRRVEVLRPWSEIDPGAQLPGAGPLSELLAGLATDDELRRRDDVELES